MPFESTSTAPTPLTDFVETVSEAEELATGAVLAALEELLSLLLLPPHAARPMATTGTAMRVRIEPRLNRITCLLTLVPSPSRQYYADPYLRDWVPRRCVTERTSLQGEGGSEILESMPGRLLIAAGEAASGPTELP